MACGATRSGPASEAKPEKWDGEILVPFAAESVLSGVMKEVGAANKLWYRRTFTPKPEWKGKRLLLHFGAVDWHATVWVNGQQVGEHKGGYDPFTLRHHRRRGEGAGGPQEIVVSVWDPTDEGEQPRGKQVRSRAASGTRRSPASGRRCGWSRCRSATSSA